MPGLAAIAGEESGVAGISSAEKVAGRRMRGKERWGEDEGLEVLAYLPFYGGDEGQPPTVVGSWPRCRQPTEEWGSGAVRRPWGNCRVREGGNSSLARESTREGERWFSFGFFNFYLFIYSN